MTKRFSLIVATAMMAVSAASAAVYIEPMIGANNMSDGMKATDKMIGGRVGVGLIDRVNAELGWNGGKSDLDNAKYHRYADAALTYDLMKDSKLVPFVAGGLGRVGAEDNRGMLGLGLKYALTDNGAIRADLRDYIDNDTKRDFVATVGYALSFGGSKAAPKPCCDTPAPVVVPAPVVEAPKPVVVPAPVVEAPKPVVVKEDKTVETIVYFDFDKSNIKKEEAAKLDKFISESKDVKGAEVTVDGYTDVLGTKGYNAKLSNKRAENVKAYLAQHGYAGNVKNVTGKGVKGPEKAKNVRAKNRVVTLQAKGYVEVTK